MTNDRRISAAALPPIKAANEQYYEYFGSTLALNTALKVLLGLALIVIAILALTVRRVALAAANRKPLIVRISDVGRAEAVNDAPSRWTPQDREIRYFLASFTHDFLARNRRTLAQDYERAYYFLDRDLYTRTYDDDRRSNWLPKFLAGAGDDCEVIVNNVVIRNLQQQPYSASVQFTKVFSAPSGAQTRRETWEAQYTFRVNRDLPNDWVLHNPLGLVITSMRTYQAFSTTTQN
jgi:type IV secretory pathway TrbF-like protein